MQIRRTAAALTSAAALSVTGVAMAVPANAAAPTLQRGLVNVDVDVTDNVVIVQLPIAIAANVCDVDVAILSQQLQRTGTASCEAAADSDATA